MMRIKKINKTTTKEKKEIEKFSGNSKYTTKENDYSSINILLRRRCDSNQ